MNLVDRVFQIFRAGTHTDMSGRVLSFSAVDIDSLARAYNTMQQDHPAPLCLGHPKDDKPAYGHVAHLFAKGDKLYAHAKVADGLDQAVKEGRYKHVSAAIYLWGSPNNPNGNHLGLRHVGFLGAWPPAVRNMDPLWEFAEGRCQTRYGQFCELTHYAAQGRQGRAFGVPPGYTADPSGLRLLALVQEYAHACPELSFEESCRLAESTLNH